MTISELMKRDGKLCSCGRRHFGQINCAVVEEGALLRIPSLVRQAGASSVYMLADLNTDRIAAQAVEKMLKEAGVLVSKYVFPHDSIFEPDEHAVGAAVLHYVPSDMVISVGSGVLNDIGKTVASMAGKPYMIVGTAPSMDGYASATSSMVRDGLKVTLPTKCPDYIVGDLGILAEAPLDMLRAGVGDMLAKYVSICEWRVGQIVTEEYYCEETAQIIRDALSRIVSLAPRLLDRDHEAVRAVMEGLIMSGVGANLADSTRVVSGGEHYFSHLWDMRSLAFGEPIYLHGIQCGAATADVLRIWNWLKSVTPDRMTALAAVRSFDYAAYSERLAAFVGEGSRAMVALEEREGKYDPELHQVRLERILAHWDEIRSVIEEEAPLEPVLATLSEIGAPSGGLSLGKTREEMRSTLIHCKDVRGKYVLARLLFDIGMLDAAADRFFGAE